MAVIANIIPFKNTQLPILHHFIFHAPHMMKHFAFRYQYAAYIRYNNGRTLQQASLASGNIPFGEYPLFCINMSDE